jgi:hypothetical protein
MSEQDFLNQLSTKVIELKTRRNDIQQEQLKEAMLLTSLDEQLNKL